MVFSSLLFLFRFLPLVLFAYYVLPKSLRNCVLFFSSLVFYAWGEPVYVVLVLLSTMVDYCAGRLVSYFKEKKSGKSAFAAVMFSAILNLTLLGFFKYGDFFLQIIHRITGIAVPALNLSLPIGISFYTFQTMSYTIDVYRGEAKVQKNIITFGAYVAMFPQLIAGPIIRYRDVDRQLRERRESVSLFSKGIVRFMTGLAKKVLIANQIGMLWDEVSGMGSGEIATTLAWLGILAFTLQIYFDFSGYSDMAIGLGAMFGFSFPENFNYPYNSKSITEFWRRWHISLGTWFREYVYIPLGGNRKGIFRQMVNIFVVWFLTGLWHGAYWNFVLWGLYYGIILVIEKIFLKSKKWKQISEKLPNVIKHFYTMLLVMFGWSIFSWQDMNDGTGYIKALLFASEAGFADREAMYLFSSYFILIFIAVIGSLPLMKNLADRYLLPEGTIRREVAGIVFVVVLFVACIAMLVNSSYNPFLYFRF